MDWWVSWSAYHQHFHRNLAFLATDGSAEQLALDDLPGFLEIGNYRGVSLPALVGIEANMLDQLIALWRYVTHQGG